jgi:hypothetical protein
MIPIMGPVLGGVDASGSMITIRFGSDKVVGVAESNRTSRASRDRRAASITHLLVTYLTANSVSFVRLCKKPYIRMIM